jgi:hypothetical protein
MRLAQMAQLLRVELLLLVIVVLLLLLLLLFGVTPVAEQ